jgi:hypothetical protein
LVAWRKELSLRLKFSLRVKWRKLLSHLKVAGIVITTLMRRNQQAVGQSRIEFLKEKKEH